MSKGLHDPREAAEIVAVQALSFIATDPERLGLFLAETGLGPQNLRQAATDSRFLAGVLDFVMRDDSMVQAFAASAGFTATAIAAAHDLLGGARWERDNP
ncbi:MAG: DUF3572 domain-containing protein [Xanthobacteraceae bacterium]